MRGQFIKLAGVTAGSTLGVPRIQMGAGDIAALKSQALAHVVSAKSLTASASGVSGRCRLTGLPLVSKGTASALTVRTADGHAGLGLTSSIAAALALPAGSASESYCAVMAINLAAADIVGSSPLNLLGSFTSGDVAAASSLRYYGQAAASNQDKFLSGGGGAIAASTPNLTRPATGWLVLAVDFNNATKLASMSINGGAFSSATKADGHAPGVGGYFEIGLHTGTLGLRGSVAGDLFLFNKSMLGASLDQAQLADVIAGLKADYAIA